MSLHGSTITITPIEPTDSITVTPNNTTVTATNNTTRATTNITILKEFLTLGARGREGLRRSS